MMTSFQAPALRPWRQRLLRWSLQLATWGWSGWFLFIAQHRWRHERICAMVCGPFVPVELLDHYRRAFDWRTPLALAALPPLLWCGWILWRRWGPRPRRDTGTS